jgi:cobalt-zinc-cadmium efflux system membrane fusion protein
VAHIAAIANRETRTVPVRVEIDNPEGRWRPGMAAQVDIEAAPISLAVALPPAAVHQIGGRDVVFVVAGAGRFEVRPVTLGYRDDRVVEIASGVTAGEKVAVTHSYLLKAEWLEQGG